MDARTPEQLRHGQSRAATVSVGPEPQWYKDAIIYQLHVKAFQDSTANGIGDFRGLMQRLGYIQDLGATTIWLLPFYPSPLRDDGYDIADYRKVNTSYGTMVDFRRFVKEAHRRGLRVITELVINHTSDQHPWFQRARRARSGTAARDFYVWSDTDERYHGTRIIFLDTETSNWTWDPVAKAYFWHRFYSHQPDLNFDNPRVLSEVIKVMYWWLDTGVDGLRLDAIPYLIEREGTNNENLPETHEVLKKIRAALDDRYDDRMLLAEANQWPEDTATYFGNGDECHMAFHFPLMPRMYMGLAQEDRHPITDIVRQMPEIPGNCQWAIFLRNHDELTLEMVTEEERDYLWRTYADDKRARINLGIRRRLAPLMQNDRRKIELMNALLLSMPGTPVIYYGDEIRMGDNYYLGDRDGVRTPMQWTADRNGGFSRANPQQLYLPPIMDPVYGFQSINVESQESDPSSLLNWMRRMVAARTQFKAFGRGEIRFLYPSNRKILAYVREWGDERILCVANLARTAQAVELDLSAFRGVVPVELTGHTPFPPIGDLPYLLTLPAYAFYWFDLQEEAEAPDWHEAPPEMLPDFVTLTTSDGTALRMLSGREGRQLRQDILPEFLPLQRWYGDKEKAIRSLAVQGLGTLGKTDQALSIVEVSTGARTSHYFLPLAIHWGSEHLRPGAPLLSYTLAKARKGPQLGAVIDGAFDDGFAIDLANAMRAGRPMKMESGVIEFDATDTLMQMESLSTARRLGAEQSNVSIIIDDKIMLKIYRRLQHGEQPDVEVGRFLTQTAGFDATPIYLGSARFLSGDDSGMTLATAFSMVHNQGDAWHVLLEALTRDLEHFAIASPPQEAPVAPPFPYPLDMAATLGRRTAELHAAFAFPTDDPAFAAIPLRKTDLKAWAKAVAGEARQQLQMLKDMKKLPDDLAEKVEKLLAARQDLLAEVSSVTALLPSGGVSRIHGDYHLGQVLINKDDVSIIDFEGEPQRALDERREKTSPLRDVAGMLRSFDYLAWAALDRRREIEGEVVEEEAGRAFAWRDQASKAFLDAYLERAAETPAHPEATETTEALIRLFTIQKAVYEIGYEAANRPSWLPIPVNGLLSLFDRNEASP
jgi:maltose alpha-D-glucosyltransferase/alpha-amylase